MTDTPKSVDDIARRLSDEQTTKRLEQFRNNVPTHVDGVEETPVPVTAVDVSFLDIVVNWFKQSIATSFLNQIEGKPMDIKNYIVKFIVQWILQLGGGVLGTIGISSGSWVEIVSAIVTFLAGTIMHLISHSQAIKTDPGTIGK